MPCSKVHNKLVAKYEFFNCPDKYWAGFAQILNISHSILQMLKYLTRKILIPSAICQAHWNGIVTRLVTLSGVRDLLLIQAMMF